MTLPETVPEEDVKTVIDLLPTLLVNCVLKDTVKNVMTTKISVLLVSMDIDYGDLHHQDKKLLNLLNVNNVIPDV